MERACEETIEFYRSLGADDTELTVWEEQERGLLGFEAEGGSGAAGESSQR